MIPALLQTAVLALLSAGVPLRSTATSTAVAILQSDGNPRIVADPSPREIESAKSTHVFAFTSHDELLLVESEGDFTVQDWERACEAAQDICCQPEKGSGANMVLDDDSDGPGSINMRQFLRSAIESKVASDLHWK